MLTQKKRLSRRISVWTLIFALTLTVLTLAMPLPAHAENFLDDARKDAGEAVSDVGDAIGHVGDAVSDAVDDMADGDQDGKVNDGDGIIGNEADEQDTEEDSPSRIGWIGVAIAILIALVVIILIIILVPRKRRR